MSFVHFHYDTVDSTYVLTSRDPFLSKCVKLLEEHEVVLVSCGYQSRGVGTYGGDGRRREWVPEVGNFFGSFLLKVPTSAVRSVSADSAEDGETCLEGLPTVLGAAIASELREISGVCEVKMKYPNDLVVDSKKIGGMFCDVPRTNDGFAVFKKGSGLVFEANLASLPTDGDIVIGLHLGINLITPTAVEATAGSLKLKDGTLNDLTRRLCDLCVRLVKDDWRSTLNRLTSSGNEFVAGLGTEVEVQDSLDDPKSSKMFFEDFSLLKGALKLKAPGNQTAKWARPRTIRVMGSSS